MRRVILSCLFVFLISGCLYRGDGIFKKIGDTDYKANINVMNMFVAADGWPLYVHGVVLLEDRITPLRNTHITLRRKDQQEIISNTSTDNKGAFNMSGFLRVESLLLPNIPYYFV